jgi:dTDP-4-dehydrorhamnose 3,5-epimerase
MTITQVEIGGAWHIAAKRFSDERGWFQEWFKKSELSQVIDFDFSPLQANISHSQKGVIRGIHYSIADKGQAKLVTVMHGSIDDYVIDINPSSENFGKWTRVRLTAHEGNALLLPPHAGHAFQALEDDTTVCYLVTAEFNPEMEKGISPLCKTVNIDWAPDSPQILSPKDINAPNLQQVLLDDALPRFR